MPEIKIVTEKEIEYFLEEEKKKLIWDVNKIYKWSVDNSVESKSRKGDPMFIVDFLFRDDNLGSKIIRNWFVIPNEPNDNAPQSDIQSYMFSMMKIKSLYEAASIGNIYKSGNINAYDLLGRHGFATLKIKHYEYNGEKRIKNDINKFIKPDNFDNGFKDDDIDF